MSSIYEVYLYKGSPFFLPFKEDSWKQAIEGARNLPMQISIVLQLHRDALNHHAYLDTHHEVLAAFAPSADLFQYFLGLLAPLEIIEVAYFEENGKYEQAEHVKQQWRGEDPAYADFRIGKVSQCRVLLNQQDPWKQIFELPYGHFWSDYFRVGVTVAEVSFFTYMNTINKLLASRR
jgi:hypothetical protein